MQSYLWMHRLNNLRTRGGKGGRKWLSLVMRGRGVSSDFSLSRALVSTFSDIPSVLPCGHGVLYWLLSTLFVSVFATLSLYYRQQELTLWLFDIYLSLSPPLYISALLLSVTSLRSCCIFHHIENKQKLSRVHV